MVDGLGHVQVIVLVSVLHDTGILVLLVGYRPTGVQGVHIVCVGEATAAVRGGVQGGLVKALHVHGLVGVHPTISGRTTGDPRTQTIGFIDQCLVVAGLVHTLIASNSAGPRGRQERSRHVCINGVALAIVQVASLAEELSFGVGGQFHAVQGNAVGAVAGIPHWTHVVPRALTGDTGGAHTVAVELGQTVLVIGAGRALSEARTSVVGALERSAVGTNAAVLAGE